MSETGDIEEPISFGIRGVLQSQFPKYFNDPEPEVAATEPEEGEENALSEPVANEGEKAAENEETEEAPAEEEGDTNQLALGETMLELERQKLSIMADLERKRRDIDNLESYLVEEESKAKINDDTELMEKDLVFTKKHRKTGVPTSRSSLTVDPALIASLNLIDGKSLFSKVENDYQSKFKANESLLDSIQASKASYLRNTVGLASRSAAQGSAIPGSRSSALPLRPIPQEGERERERRKGAVEEEEETSHERMSRPSSATLKQQRKRRATQDMMGPADLQREKMVLKRMNARVEFVKNPASLTSKDIGQLPPSTQIKLKGTAENVFEVIPPVVEFTGYVPGEIYEIPVEFKNTSTVSRRLRLLPPVSGLFSISLTKFPSAEGSVAPGLSAVCLVRFRPATLADVDTSLTLVTEFSQTSIPVVAYRLPPELTLPSQLELGSCLPFGVKRWEVPFENVGGEGRFRLLPRKDARSFEAESPELSVGDFVVQPPAWQMAPGEVRTLYIDYCPTLAGSSEQTIYIACDNLQVIPLRLSGQCVVPTMTVQAKLSSTVWDQ
mgnify:FL=1